MASSRAVAFEYTDLEYTGYQRRSLRVTALRAVQLFCFAKYSKLSSSPNTMMLQGSLLIPTSRLYPHRQMVMSIYDKHLGYVARYGTNLALFETRDKHCQIRV